MGDSWGQRTLGFLPNMTCCGFFFFFINFKQDNEKKKGKKNCLSHGRLNATIKSTTRHSLIHSNLSFLAKCNDIGGSSGKGVAQGCITVSVLIHFLTARPVRFDSLHTDISVTARLFLLVLSNSHAPYKIFQSLSNCSALLTSPIRSVWQPASVYCCPLTESLGATELLATSFTESLMERLWKFPVSLARLCTGQKEERQMKNGVIWRICRA